MPYSIGAETLIEFGFKPTRTLVLAFGFDEEIGGQNGAEYIGKYLLEKYGENGLAMIIDEGGGFTQWITEDAPG